MDVAVSLDRSNNRTLPPTLSPIFCIKLLLVSYVSACANLMLSHLLLDAKKHAEAIAAAGALRFSILKMKPLMFLGRGKH
jgi:hypothetical protein